MPEEVKLWRIEEGDRLEECVPAKLNLEERLETWIEQDVATLSPDLLIIGRQVETDFGGVIDLLCLDPNGDTVIVELKRDMTPRDVVAQTLDYASWVRDLSNDRLSTIASRHLGQTVTLEDAFAKKFGSELPDVLNENHGILIVGSRIDASTERIIKYLSDAHGVSINAVSFQYFQTQNGHELLARVFLIEPDTIEYQARTKSSSKRRRNLTLDELQSMADDKGVGELYARFVADLSLFFYRHTTRSSIAFTGNLDGSRKAVFSLIPDESSREKGLYFQIYFRRFCQLFSMDDSVAVSLLPENREEWSFDEADPDWSGFAGYFRDNEQVECFVTGLKGSPES